jgi:hypothetical protein
MNASQQLDMLQTLDLELDRLKSQAAAARASMSEPGSLSDARDSLQKTETQLEKARKVYRDRDYEVRDGQARINDLEARLYGGQITAPKELANLQREVESLKALQATREERSLESLSLVEQAQAAQAESLAAVNAIEAEWAAAQTTGNAELAALEQNIAARQARRQAQAAGIDPPSLAAYERLRPIKGGRAVARVTGDRCDGCRLILPSGAAARVRSSFELVYCVNCGRILCR